MNRRDLLKALSSVIPASWMAKWSSHTQEIALPLGAWVIGKDRKTIDIVYVAGEDIRRGEVVSFRNGGRVMKASVINYLCRGVCTRDAKAGQKCLVRIVGQVNVVECR